MTNDPTTVPDGEADMPETNKQRPTRRSGRVTASARPDLRVGMMGDGTEEQNLNQVGDPSLRIREDEVDSAFEAGGAGKRVSEQRSFLSAEDRAEKMAALTEKVSALRDQVQQSAEAARTWAMKQADVAKRTASDKPVLVISASAGAALAVGLAVGFIIGRATADD